ncbi:FixH family protein [Paenibacillus sp. SI8]|uniref:FixH family protein n=1 Tax=unclassified Paenibacillus TaxID=185978 RepID=UPI0034659093
MRFRSLLPLLALPVLLSVLPACGSAGTATAEASGVNSPGQELKIAFSTSPQTITTGTPVNLTAVLTKGTKTVKDANVILEIWKADQDDGAHYQQEAKYDAASGYVLKGSFVETGVYYVLVHATTSDAHQMISAKFEVSEAK